MKQTAVLVISSLLAMLFGTFRGFAPGGLSNVSVVLVVISVGSVMQGGRADERMEERHSLIALRARS